MSYHLSSVQANFAFFHILSSVWQMSKTQSHFQTIFRNAGWLGLVYILFEIIFPEIMLPIMRINLEVHLWNMTSGSVKNKSCGSKLIYCVVKILTLMFRSTKIGG